MTGDGSNKNGLVFSQFLNIAAVSIFIKLSEVKVRYQAMENNLKCRCCLLRLVPMAKFVVVMLRSFTVRDPWLVAVW